MSQTKHHPRIRSTRIRFLPKLFIGILLPAMLFAVLATRPAQDAAAQATSPDWTSPVNLSLSGAASQPRIVSGLNESLQAFWLDRFDGLVTAVFDGSAWSQPQLAPIPNGSVQMPTLIADLDGWVHAFWQVSSGQRSPQDPTAMVNTLYHSQMPVGGVAWSVPEILAEDALAYSISAPVNGGLRLAYIRRLNTSDAPAGVYIRWLSNGGASWGTSQNVYASIYYRLLSPGSVNISLTDDGAGNLFIVWNDSISPETLVVQSNDDGASWSQAGPFGDPENQPVAAGSPVRLTGLLGQVLSIQEAINASGCLLFQQNWLQASEWSAAEQIFTNLDNCPSGDSFWPDAQSNRIYWLWGAGSSSLSLTAWDEETAQWSIPLLESFSFEDPTSTRQVILAGLQATLANDRLAVVGTDSVGEIWVTRLEKPLSDFAYAPPPAWSSIRPVTGEEQTALDFGLVMDEQGTARLVYTRPDQGGELGASLMYSDWESVVSSVDQGLDNNVVIFAGNPNELTRQPALLVDQANNLLHLVWSGGEQGDILYSRVPLDKANTVSEWFPAQTLSSSAFAVWPQIGIDSNNRLYVLYTIPYNEERGVYLVRSEDRGQSWGIATRIFDAAAAGLRGVDHPSLVIAPDGTLHAAWVETSPAGNNQPQGIYYATSTDGGDTWSKPLILAGPGNDWPKLAIADGQLHLIFAQLAQRSSSQQDAGFLWSRNRSIQAGSEGQAANPESEESAWSSAGRLPGWDETSLPYGVSMDGAPEEGHLHVVGVNPANGYFSYSVWSDGAWGPAESFQSSTTRTTGMGLQAATRPQGEALAIAWLRNVASQDSPNDRQQPGLYFTTRNIDPQVINVKPTVQPTATPAPIVLPTPTVLIPTPTPDLNIIPPPAEFPQAPLFIGVAVSALVVIGLFLLRLVKNRRG